MRRGRVFDDAGRPVTADLDGPCTPNQWGRVRREFERLGLADLDGAQLEARLLLTGQLAGRGAAVSSTRDLTAGEAGRVVRLLAGCRTLSDAEALADPGPGAGRAEDPAPDYRRRLVTVLLRAMINQALREAARR